MRRSYFDRFYIVNNVDLTGGIIGRIVKFAVYNAHQFNDVEIRLSHLLKYDFKHFLYISNRAVRQSGTTEIVNIITLENHIQQTMEVSTLIHISTFDVTDEIKFIQIYA